MKSDRAAEEERLRPSQRMELQELKKDGADRIAHLGEARQSNHASTEARVERQVTADVRFGRRASDRHRGPDDLVTFLQGPIGIELNLLDWFDVFAGPYAYRDVCLAGKPQARAASGTGATSRSGSSSTSRRSIPINSSSSSTARMRLRTGIVGM